MTVSYSDSLAIVKPLPDWHVAAKRCRLALVWSSIPMVALAKAATAYRPG
jgi:hypothetical protein